MFRKKTLKKVRPKHIYRNPKLKIDSRKMNIALIGSPRYENVRNIRDFIFNVKTKLGNNINIISRGNN